MTDTPDRGIIARQHGLPAGLADSITGDTEADLRESADRLAAALGRHRGPRPDPTQGAQQRDLGVGQLGRGDLARMTPAEIVAAQESGRFDDLMSGRYT